MKPLFCALALCTVLAPALAQDAATAPVAASQAAPIPTIKLDNGLSVTPVARPATDLETLADAHFWRFHIEAPSATGVSQQLELRVPGKPPQIIGTPLAFVGVQSLDVLIGLAPIDGGYLVSANNWKIYQRVQGPSQGPKPFDFPMIGAPANPLKSFKFGPIRYGTERDYSLPQTNGDVPLITLHAPNENPMELNAKTESPVVAELVLVVGARPNAN